MGFRLSEEQEMFRKSVRDYVNRELPKSWARDLEKDKIATFRVPRYVRFVTEWPMSGIKIKKAILREMIVADLKDKGITHASKISTSP